MSKFFYEKEIKDFPLEFIGDRINYNNTSVLEYYPEYRGEQQKNEKTLYYDVLWKRREVFNYHTLKPIKTIDITRKITHPTINDKNELFLTCTPTIVEYQKGKYRVNQRWINYQYHPNGSKKKKPPISITLNSMFEVNLDGKNLKEIISQETFLPDQHIVSSGDKTQGVEDVRLFTFQNKTYYNASVLNHSSNIIATSVNEYQFYQPYKINILKPSFFTDHSTKCRCPPSAKFCCEKKIGHL